MTIKKEDIMHIAYLARLELNDSEVEQMRTHFNRILEYVAQLEELPDKPPGKAGFERETHLREDVVGETLSTKDSLRSAPKVRDDMIVVPEVISDE
jgi:aspartyl-tRNA(Asn)/glutamyl-tRNA(Gln) amidotransferase subunit C